MIKTLVVNNFKAITNLEISFTPLSVLVGSNSSGKSTILQVIDFARAFATRDIDEYLIERGWMLDDLKTQFPGRGMAIKIGLNLCIDDEQQTMIWSIALDNKAERVFTTEKIYNQSKGKLILDRGGGKSSTPENLDKLYLKSSYLKLIDENNPSPEVPAEYYAIKRFFAQSSSYELLAPDRMREKGSRGGVNDIGLGGELLAAYINRMTAAQKSKLAEILSDLVGYPAKTSTETKRPGWVDLFLNESFPETSTKIKVAHISDGILRLIALVAASLPEENAKKNSSPNSGFILLDEIEDGINLNLIEKAIDLLRKAVGDSNKQVILTTHSPVVADSLRPEEITYMWRDSNGYIQAKPMFSTDQMRRTLRALSPGEVWMNYDNEEILDRLAPKVEET